MVTLNRIYTRTGDAGATRLATGESVSKAGVRIAANGDIDETNACLGIARAALAAGDDLDAMLSRIQNELFDLGADISTPRAEDETPGAALRIVDSQILRLEAEIDTLNSGLPALQSFILPGGTPAAAALHLARTVCRRAERAVVRLIEEDGAVNPAALRYINRLSDFLFVAARHANDQGRSEVFWKSGATR